MGEEEEEDVLRGQHAYAAQLLRHTGSLGVVGIPTGRK